MNEEIKVPTMKVPPLKKICMTIGQLPASYVESMSYYEMLVWFVHYLRDDIIPVVNANGLATRELQELFVELQNYVNNYLTDANLQPLIDNKLDEMVEDGTFDEIINQTLFSEINEKIDNNALAIDNNARNSKYICYIFQDTETRQSIPYFTEFLTRCKNAGFKESQMLISINNDGTIDEDITKFSQYNQIANDLNIPITSIKFHGSYSSQNYQETILTILQYFPDVKTVFIFNEQLNDVYSNGLGYPATIKLQYPNIEKVGFTISYPQAFYGNNVTNAQWEAIENVFDLVGVHLYPSCSSYNDPSNCLYQNVLLAFNNCQLQIPWHKEIWITESGVLPYWQMMELPENYDLSLLTDTTFTTAPQRLFYQALNDCEMSRKATKIIPWYLESGMSDSNHEMFDILKEIITNR